MLRTGPQWLTPKLRQLASANLPLAPDRPALRPRPQRRSAEPGRWIHRQFRGDAGAREYDVYLPSGLSPDDRVPVLLLLHGCRQRPVEFAAESGFVAAADAEGFLIVAPRQDPHHQLQRCWRWYESEHQARGGGEPAILAGIVAEVAAEGVGAEGVGAAEPLWRVDRRRVYAAGLSAGGAMSLILATTYPDVFAAVGVHSATAYRSATEGFGAFGAMAAQATMPSHDVIHGEMAPVVLIHGTNDPVVRAPNADRIVDQWLASRHSQRLTGLDRVRPLATTRALMVDGRRCIRTRWYTARGRRVLEYWRVDGLRHAWSGGRHRGAFIDLKGPHAAEVMTTFFQRHKLPHASLSTAAETEDPPVRQPMIWFEDTD